MCVLCVLFLSVLHVCSTYMFVLRVSSMCVLRVCSMCVLCVFYVCSTCVLCVFFVSDRCVSLMVLQVVAEDSASHLQTEVQKCLHVLFPDVSVELQQVGLEP